MKQLVAQFIVALVVEQGAPWSLLQSFYCVNSADMSFWMPRKLSWIMPHAPLQVKFLYFPYLFVQAIERLHVIICVPVTAVHNS